jgi:uncharacterized membrane protein
LKNISLAVIIACMTNEMQDKTWSVTLTPHRSLSREGFVALMLILLLINFVGGLLFLISGAWPVAGFMGLDVLLVWWAFRQNFRDGRRAERIVVKGDHVMLHRLSPEGKSDSLEFNRPWLRVELEFDDAREVVGRLLLSYRGVLTEIGSFLGAAERQSLSKALQQALS